MWRINRKHNTWYCRNFNLTGTGHLQFTDLEGRRRVISAGEEWTIAEVDQLPADQRAKIEDAEVMNA